MGETPYFFLFLQFGFYPPIILPSLETEDAIPFQNFSCVFFLPSHPVWANPPPKKPTLVLFVCVGGYVYRGAKYDDLLGGNYIFAEFTLK